MKTQSLVDHDTEEICSLRTKVERKSDAKHVITYTTDIIAIRDCISYGRYKITKSDDGKSYNLQFEWKEQWGYNFSKPFTAFEFVEFIEDYLLFEKLQAILLVISMTEMLMAPKPVFFL